MTSIEDKYLTYVINELDFEPEIPCEAKSSICFTKEHPADWYMTTSCGCSKYICDVALQKFRAVQTKDPWYGGVKCTACGASKITIGKLTSIRAIF